LPFCHFALKAEKPKDSGYSACPETLGDHLKKKRLDLGLNQKQAGQEIGVDETTIYNWEHSRTVPALRLMPSLGRFLGYAPYTPAQSLPEKLKALRQSMGLSRKRLAKLLGVDESSLANWETGRTRPNKKSREIIEGFLQWRNIDAWRDCRYGLLRGK
jgi:transcriptional regulator with XRE-family HTH domain